MTNPTKAKIQQGKDSELMSPMEVAIRWRCARSTVDRITEREGMSRLYLGKGANGMVRYFRAEVIAFEERQTIKRKKSYR